MVNPLEMANASHDDVVKAVKADRDYVAAFQKVFGREPSIDDVAAAIASFERTVVSGNSPFDRFSAGEKDALDASARRGWELWNGKARCNTCHPFGDITPNFSDNKFHNIGVAAKGRDFASLSRKAAQAGDPAQLAFLPDFTELGRFAVTRQPKDIGAFKTPGLRDVALTAPYMHDGSIATLDEVIAHYEAGGRTIAQGDRKGVGASNPRKSSFVKGFTLTPQERADLKAFLESLTDRGFVTNPRFGNPWLLGR
jgi:cytochrome c peroxidase